LKLDNGLAEITVSLFVMPCSVTDGYTLHNKNEARKNFLSFNPLASELNAGGALKVLRI
jgi:hypothetical protein